MTDKPNDRPKPPEQGARDLVIKNVPSMLAHVFENWLREEAQKTKYRTPTDIFSDVVQRTLYKELGVDATQQRYGKYCDEQLRLQAAYIRHCDKHGWPDEEEWGDDEEWADIAEPEDHNPHLNL